MQISPTIEEPTRKLFGHAIRAELDDFERQLNSFDARTIGDAVQLATFVTGGVVLEITGGRKPTDADLRKLAETAEKAQKRYELAEDQVYTYLSQCVFCGESLDKLFDVGEAVALPFLVAGNLLGSYTHADQGQDWWEYLDQIEAAIEASPDPAQH